MYRVSVLREQMTTTLPISLSNVAGKSADPRYTNFLLELYAKAAWLRLHYLYSKSEKKMDKLVNRLSKKHFLLKHQILLRWAPNIKKFP